MEKKKRVSFNEAIKGVGASARKEAFRNNLPVAISENGRTILVFPDGSRKPFTKKIMQDLQHAQA